MTAWYSVLHMLVDGVCAMAMFGDFLLQKEGYLYMLLYNFCAFALQMPFGVVLDILNESGARMCISGKDTMDSKMIYEKKEWSFSFAVVGVLCTILGVVTNPIILGVGNALFHVGGGVGTIHEDERKQWKGRGLGIFVAPGALGVYLGTQLAKKNIEIGWLIGVSILLVGICSYLIYEREMQCERAIQKMVDTREERKRRRSEDTQGKRRKSESVQKNVKQRNPENIQGNVKHVGNGESCNEAFFSGIWVSVCCLIVVILRAYVGMAASFSWKAMFGGCCVLATVLGKMTGGFLAARFGNGKVVIASLVCSALGYLCSGYAPFGIMTIFLFNMTMPITLYSLVCRFPTLPGFSFGLLTFGLFLGFLPEYLGWKIGGMSVQGIGCVGSVLSLVLLVVAIRKGGTHDGVSA